MNLPHADYIEAVTDALTAAGLKPAETDVRDSETCGATPFLDAVITLTPEDSGIPGTRTGHDRLEFHRRSIRERIPEETSLVVIEGPAMSLGYPLVVLPDTHRRALDGVQWPENLPAVAR